MNNLLDTFSRHEYFLSIVSSFAIILFMFFFGKVLKRNLNNKDIKNFERTSEAKRINNYTQLASMFFIFVIWFSHIQGVLIPFFAIAAAIVLALKELIMCFTGGMLLRSAHTFKIGDRIEINNIRGFVVDKGFFATKILEIGPDKNSQQTTGNIITFSNSLVFANYVRNESYFQGYSIKSYNYNVPDHHELDEMESFLREEGNKICTPYIEEAKKSINTFCNKEGIRIPPLEAKTKLVIDKDNKFSILLRIPVNNDEIGDVEQKLNRAYLRYINSHVPQKVS